MTFKLIAILLLEIIAFAICVWGENGLAIKSIQSEDGDVIDCIDIFKQPAFYHPALKSHKIQMTPTYNPKMETRKINDEAKTYKCVTTQTWHKSGSCPKGTIPIRRRQNINKDQIKKPNFFNQHKGLKIKKDINPTQKNSSVSSTKHFYQCSLICDEQFFSSSHLANDNHMNHANSGGISIFFKDVFILKNMEGFRYMGGKTDMKTWNPHVEEDDEYSTSRLALKSGPYYDYQAIESGWAVNPRVYGDRQTRLFTYWTNDGSRNTGCFDLTCPGFVQTSHEIALGAAIYPISTQNGLPYSITIYIYKDLNTSNWWLQYGGSINIGYWPSNIFEGGLEIHAETVQWGGEVYSKNVGKHPHTKTQMGSGAFPIYIFPNTGFMKYMRILDNTMELRFPQIIESYSEEYDCYRTQYMGDYVEEPEFHFGGPGRNPLCP